MMKNYRAILAIVASCLSASSLHSAAAQNYMARTGANADPTALQAFVTKANLPPVVHQNSGCVETGNVALTGACNILLLADYFNIYSTDASIGITLTITGTPTNGESIGMNATVNSIPYTITYTVQAGDTTTTLIAAKLATCFSATPDAHCNISPTTFKADLLALGYTTTSSGSANTVLMDMPWGLTSVWTVISSAHLTVSTNNINASPLDNGPYVSASRFVSGRTPMINDPVGWFRGDGASTSSSGVDTQYAGAKVRTAVVSSTAPQGMISLETAYAEASNKASVPRFTCRQGCWVEPSGDGVPNQAYDPGYGGLTITANLLGFQIATSAVSRLISTQSTAYAQVDGTLNSILTGVIGNTAVFIQNTLGAETQIQGAGGALSPLAASNLRLTGTIAAPNLATSSAATTGTLCWTTGTGNVNVDTTTTCLLSSARFKHDWSPIAPGAALAEVMRYRPGTFLYNDDLKIPGQQAGFLAEDIAAVNPELAVYGDDGLPLKLKNPMAFVAKLTAAVQEQQREIDGLRRYIGYR